MLDDVRLPVRDLSKSRAFYTAVLSPLGLSAQFEYVNTLSFGTPGHSWLTLAAVLEPPVQVGIGFRAETQTQVDNFHATAMAAGGDDRGAPGYQSGGKTNYSACVFDPDGHYVYVACRTTEA